MDINALRVFNSIHNLGITEQEFKEIEEEQNYTEKTGLYIQAIKKGYSICVSHDEKHKILIKDISEYRTTPKPKSRVLFKTLINFSELPTEIYTLHQIAQYRALDTEIRYVANNIEELKDRICDRFSDKYPKELGGMYDDSYSYGIEEREKNKELKIRLAIKQMEAIFWLFGEDYKNFKMELTRKNVPRIIKVFSRNNRRVAIIQINEEFDKQRGVMYQERWTEQIERTTLKIQTFTPRDRRYNYVCPNRELYLPTDYYSEKGQIWVDDDLFEKISAEELKVLASKYDGWILLTADEYNKQKSALRIELISARRKSQEEEAEEKLVSSIKEQFKAGKVVRQGIAFTEKSISYNGLIITGSKIGEYLTQNNIILQERPYFNDIFEGYIDYILKLDVFCNYYNHNRTIFCRFMGKEKISIGKIKITIEKINNNIFINNHRICQDDLRGVIKEAINCDRQKDFEEWVSYTSKVNLKLQKALKKGGIDFELKIDNTNDNGLKYKAGGMFLSLPLTRKKGRNYVLITSKEYKVKDTKALFDLEKNIDSCRVGYSGGGYLQRTIRLLYKAIDGITPKEIGDLIKSGRKEYRKLVAKIEEEKRKRLERSKEFVAHAVRITKAKRVHKGYFVNGISGTTYFVGNDLEVWTIKNGKQHTYLCIIDIGTDRDDAGRNDAIAKRLLALSKDKVVAKEIYDKGDKMDKWWREIAETKEIEVIA